MLYKNISPIVLSRACHPPPNTTELKRGRALRDLGREVLSLLQCREKTGRQMSTAVSYSKAFNCLAAIAVLPTEILLTVFENLGAIHIKHLFNAALTCSSWRELINNTPHLWTTIVSDRTPAYLIHAAFIRSAGYPVNVAIASRQASVDQVLHRYPQFATQIYSAVLCLGDTKSGLGALRQNFIFPSLRELKVTANKPRKPKSPSELREPQTLFGTREGDRFPALRVLHLDTVCPIATDVDIICTGIDIGRTLEKLTITSVVLTFDAIDVIFKDSPNLIEFALVNCKTRSNKKITTITATRPMKNLKMLSLIKCDAAVFWHSLILVDAPKLETLMLNIPELTNRTAQPSRNMGILKCDDMSIQFLEFVSDGLSTCIHYAYSP